MPIDVTGGIQESNANSVFTQIVFGDGLHPSVPDSFRKIIFCLNGDLLLESYKPMNYSTSESCIFIREYQGNKMGLAQFNICAAAEMDTKFI
jgi:hypothetical protein